MATRRYTYARKDGSLVAVPANLDGVRITVKPSYLNSFDNTLMVQAHLPSGLHLITKFYRSDKAFQNITGSGQLDGDVLDPLMDTAQDTALADFNKDMLNAWAARAELAAHLIPLEDIPKHLNSPGIAQAARESLERKLA